MYMLSVFLMNKDVYNTISFCLFVDSNVIQGKLLTTRCLIRKQLFSPTSECFTEYHLLLMFSFFKNYTSNK